MRPRRALSLLRLGLALLAPVGVAACNDVQSALAPHGASAERIARLIVLFTAVATLVFTLVVVALAAALIRRRGREEREAEPLVLDGDLDAASTRVVAAAVAATGIILVALTILSYLAGKNLTALAGPNPLTLRVTAQQWWWQVRYEDPDPSRTLVTANEIHIPVGEPVRIRLAAGDVIHSLWVPSLAGKEDLIPGRSNELVLRADRPGVYRGQCAEFCGLQHAHMAILVVAEPREAYDAWREAQLKPAAEPQSDEARRGKDVFLSKPCMMCHQIVGTPAGGQNAPDLTHVASRRTLAAGSLAMTRGSLAAWIADPHAIKPGVNMPRVALDPDELNAVVSYLWGLK